MRYAQDFFLPLVLAGLLSFLLSPLVRQFERWHLGRAGSVIITAILAFSLIGGLTYLVTSEFLDLAGTLPNYRTNLIKKVEALKTHSHNPLKRAAQTISEVTAELNKPDDSTSPPGDDKNAAPDQAHPESQKSSAPEHPKGPPAEKDRPSPVNKDHPLPVEVVASHGGPLQMLKEVLLPVARPLGDAFVVIVLVIFMLQAGADLRDRLIHLLGRSRLRVTTQALDEIAQRISRYLLAQLLVNTSFGLCIGVGLYFIGIPNAPFWGLLGTVLRFLPYVGSWIAAALPLTLSVAIYQSWTQPLLTLGLYVAVELLVANVVEPWLYGATTAISPLAVIVSALFWTWLWGGVGLLLSTPLTVCLAVAGKYLPDLAFLDLLIGESPSISNGDRLYQRLLALNEEEVSDMVETEISEGSALTAFDDAVLPALRSIEADFRAGLLTEAARSSACQILRQLLGEITPPPIETASTTPPILCIPASHEVDELGALLLAHVLSESGVKVTVLSSKLLAAEAIEKAGELAPSIVFVSSMPPISTIAARALCKRLRARLPFGTDSRGPLAA